MSGITPQSPVASIPSSGTYTGNDGVNRAIPHSLGRIPAFVVISPASAAAGVCFITNGEAAIKSGTTVKLAVTAPTSSNFYVGNAGDYTGSANANLVVYQWAVM
jgi:hypothetical protein